MAENIVQSLFGLSPYDVQQTRLQDTNAQALQYAKLDPFQKANMSLYQAGSGLGRMGAGMMGMVDPKEQEAQLAEMGQSQIDHSTPEGLLKGAEMFNQVGNPKMAMMYAQAAQAMKEKQSKLDLEAAHAKYYANGGSKGKTVQNLLAQLPAKQAIARQGAMQQGMAGNLSGKALTDFVNEQVRMTTVTWLQTVKNINESSSTELNADGTTVQPLPIDYGSYLAEANPEAPTVQGKVDIAGAVSQAQNAEKPTDIINEKGIAVSVPFKDAANAPLAQYSPQNISKIEGGKKTAELTSVSNEDEFKKATSSKEALPKINGLINQLNNSDASTGMGAELIKGFNRAKALLGGEEAAKKASDTEILDVMMGSEVFPLIQSLGLGAKGMDTPPEREFMRSVLTGAITLNKATLLRMANIRKDAAENNIVKFNSRINSGELDSFFEGSNRVKAPIEFNVSSKLDLSTPEKIKEIQQTVSLLRKTDPVGAEQLLNDLKTQLKKPKLTKEQALEIAKSRGLIPNEQQ